MRNYQNVYLQQKSNIPVYLTQKINSGILFYLPKILPPKKKTGHPMVPGLCICSYYIAREQQPVAGRLYFAILASSQTHSMNLTADIRKEAPQTAPGKDWKNT
jgi:hypothetical protein